MTSRTRRLTALAIAVAVMRVTTHAQTANPSVATAPRENQWSLSIAASTYVLSDDREYVQPTVIADRGRLHLEARSNYEGLNTGSVWMGVNFSGDQAVEWQLTPMFGGVFGDTSGVAPGLKASLGWRKLELYGENEYVVDANNRADSYFYNWSELTLAPADWIRFGMVTQRTRVYQSDREIQRGVLAGLSLKHANLTAYLFNPDKDTRFVLALELTF
jgi:hypothetical protein